MGRREKKNQLPSPFSLRRERKKERKRRREEEEKAGCGSVNANSEGKRELEECGSVEEM